MQRMPNKLPKWAFVSGRFPDRLDGPMMRPRARFAPLSVHAGGQSRNHLGNQAREGPPGADGKPLACPGTTRNAGSGSVRPTRARASRTVGGWNFHQSSQAHAREGFTSKGSSAFRGLWSGPRARGLHVSIDGSPGEQMVGPTRARASLPHDRTSPRFIRHPSPIGH
jgi:hypothetical protein